MNLSLCIMSLLLIFSSCQENEEISSMGKKTLPARPGPGGLTGQPGGYPSPEITKHTYIPEYEPFAFRKCIAWRIEWPVYDYDHDVNEDLIPTFFTLSKGALNSLNYLLNSTNETKSHLNFSLFTDAKVEAAPEVSDLWVGFEPISADLTKFVRKDFPLATIEYMVTYRPSLFENYWSEEGAWGVDVGYGLDYQAGDFFMFKLLGNFPESDKYGGIRIVSTTPRVIEVYWARENY